MKKVGVGCRENKDGGGQGLKISPHRLLKAKLLLLVVLIIFPWFSACARDAKPLQPPLSLPFEMQKAGNKVETELRVIEHRGYLFDLQLMYKERDQVDRARVKKLAGAATIDKYGNLVEPGILILLRLKIEVVDDSGVKLMFEQEISELRLTSHGADSFDKRIAVVPLKPGRYRISVESLKDVPDLVGTPVIFRIGFYAKSTPIK